MRPWLLLFSTKMKVDGVNLLFALPVKVRVAGELFMFMFDM